MSNLLYQNQFKTTTLSVVGGIDDSQTTGIVIQSTSGLETSKPGIACISYADPLDMDNAEFIEYEAINSTTNTFTGVIRGQEGYSAKSHNNASIVAFPVSESHNNRLANALSIEGVATNGVTTTKDEDDMASNSATALATQQSIKAYVDGLNLSANSYSYISEASASGTTFTTVNITEPQIVIPTGETHAVFVTINARCKTGGSGRGQLKIYASDDSWSTESAVGAGFGQFDNTSYRPVSITSLDTLSAGTWNFRPAIANLDGGAVYIDDTVVVTVLSIRN